MTTEEKELLLKDLCARLPYGMKVSVTFHDKRELFVGKEKKLTGILNAVYPDEERVIVDELNEAIAPVNVRCGGFLLEEDSVKPYLRPLSSMTEEEADMFEDEFGFPMGAGANETEFNVYDYIVIDFGYHINLYISEMVDMMNWFYSHHFDVYHLIEKGLALEAPYDMYKTE